MVSRDCAVMLIGDMVTQLNYNIILLTKHKTQ